MGIVDNNILSSLAKINRLDLLKKFFQNVTTTPEVIHEFRAETIAGYDFPEEIQKRKTYKEVDETHWIEVVNLTSQESEHKEKFIQEGLSQADAECLSVALNQEEMLITDDTELGRRAHGRGAKVYDLETFLEACARRKIISSSQEAREIISRLEEKDYYAFSEQFKTQIISILQNQ